MDSDSQYRITCIFADADLRQTSAGRTLIGGSPLRLLRLTEAGARSVAGWIAGETVAPTAGAQGLARRLITNGMFHPVIVPRPSSSASVTLVIPAYNNPALVDAALSALAVATVIVVDDASVPAEAERLAEVARTHGAQLIRRSTNGGPAAARNDGWRAATTDLVAFVDADVAVTESWLDELISHFDDPGVAAVAPRVHSDAGASNTRLDRYEHYRSALDMGPRAGRVAPRTRIPYVPSAALVVRRQTLIEVDGFVEGMRVGEDVDLIWRLGRAGYETRYEPASIVRHKNRDSWLELARQRRAYGTAAADLERRHPSMVTPVEINIWSLVSWALIVGGGPAGAAIGVATAASTAAALVPKLRDRVDDPAAEAARLGGLGHLHAGRWLGAAVTRTWLPGFVVASLLSKRFRRTTAAAIGVPSLLEWRKERTDIDPVRWIAFRLLDDASYCAGVWQGAAEHRSARVLKPTFTHIKGLP